MSSGNQTTLTQRIVPAKRITILYTSLFLIVIIPFLVFGKQMESWLLGAVADASENAVLLNFLIAASLAADIFLPVPSSIIATSSGYFSGIITGSVVSFIGLSIGCIVGYEFSLRFRSVVERKFLDSSDTSALDDMRSRFGTLWLVVCRAIPVLAETSVFLAGTTRIDRKSFLVSTSFANLGIALTYAVAGSISAQFDTLLVAIAASIFLPVLAAFGYRLVRSHIR